MKNFEKIINELNKELEETELKLIDVLLVSESCILKCKQALMQMKSIFIKLKKLSNDDEIEFFKSIKPKVYSKLIYYVKLFNVESKRPRSSNKSQVKYLNKHIGKLQDYFNDNLEFYWIGRPKYTAHSG
ncbi:RteC domain-containing protein [Flagellimonas sp. CMM7]|uniref:RteC domain-containing protein n=1 Tax=Flagellimonas sp. CMM7 TaxID=2654676 RepID=UPI001F15FFF4|nr:RteC domain-containing protein [Flagellimonas sp. CMM7]UII78787.1 RteC domain-containing protein [Flagellimonas sp. CMM7]